jgi:hypothetical protein
MAFGWNYLKTENKEKEKRRKKKSKDLKTFTKM